MKRIWGMSFFKINTYRDKCVHTSNPIFFFSTPNRHRFTSAMPRSATLFGIQNCQGYSVFPSTMLLRNGGGGCFNRTLPSKWSEDDIPDISQTVSIMAFQYLLYMARAKFIRTVRSVRVCQKVWTRVITPGIFNPFNSYQRKPIRINEISIEKFLLIVCQSGWRNDGNWSSPFAERREKKRKPKIKKEN